MAAHALLSRAEIEAGLADLPDWAHEDGTLRRTVKAYDFPSAVRVVDQVVVDAQKLDHHPDIDIRYNTVHFSLSTHSVGGVTAADLELAHRIEEAAGRLVQGHD